MWKFRANRLLVFLIAIYVVPISASPAKRSSRMIREIYPEIVETENHENVCIVGDVLYRIGEKVPADQPCLRCKCQPPGVQCETIRCEKKPGCKAIHKPNKCCPDYQCECESDGRRYANGERLETPPGGECKVCYCRGGEIQCAEVTCYVRSDCEGRQVPGTCCPKYDHCPPREPLTYHVNNPDVTSENEILSRPVTPTLIDATVETSTDSTAITNDIQDRADVLLNDEHITIQEIGPAVKEIAITEAAPSDDPSPPDNESDSSEISEVYYHPSPVLKIGNQLLVLNKGEFVPGKGFSTPQSVITIVGAEGLQRGEEEIAESSIDEDDEIAAPSTHILSLVRPKHAESTTKPSPGTTLYAEDGFGAKDQTLPSASFGLKDQLSVPEPTEIGEMPMDASTALMTEAIISKIKSITHAETTTDIAHLLEQIYIRDVAEEKRLEMNETIRANKEQNPAYPPIPDWMSPEVEDAVERTDAELAHIAKLGETLEGNDTIDNPLINKNLSLPEELLVQPVLSDFVDEFVDNATVVTRDKESIVTLQERPRESLEVVTEEDSGETVTTKSIPSIQAFAVENASVENAGRTSQEVENVETPRLAHDEDIVANRGGEAIDGATESNARAANESGSIETDVELIDPKIIVEDLDSKENVSSADFPQAKTYNTTKIVLYKDNSTTATSNKGGEQTDLNISTTAAIPTTTVNLQQPESTTTPLTRNGKTSPMRSRPDTDEEVFQQLNAELASVRPRVELTDANSDAIFKELLDDATSPPPNAEHKEKEMMQKVSDTITRFRVKDGRAKLDSSIMGILREFFSTQ